jgi:hypothetical protein
VLIDPRANSDELEILNRRGTEELDVLANELMFEQTIGRTLLIPHVSAWRVPQDYHRTPEISIGADHVEKQLTGGDDIGTSDLVLGQNSSRGEDEINTKFNVCWLVAGWSRSFSHKAETGNTYFSCTCSRTLYIIALSPASGPGIHHLSAHSSTSTLLIFGNAAASLIMDSAAVSTGSVRDDRSQRVSDAFSVLTYG